ncbi:MarR family transcriptional regulator [Sphingobium indicum IP26]|uniref:MarR family transcriptional regulator n=1 Tax=Sphingobium indicum F2 TaxID=1450518 RepID=A0A8E1C1N1_9SPHN|nr:MULTISPECIES: MarR family transcriptional regulator [Sphingobium]EPR08909.1 MarR family transcriptional regulator [Sphingobium indicum IP26]EQB07046.1 MarR family transcriptional regulator [Sphingobium sp. HDIP04]KER35123.1 MarR family transcriptional regulator [Sphingobium indicum F2]
MPAALPLDDQLCFSLYAASMAIGRAYKPMLDRLGITYPQYLVLHALWEQDGRTIGQIAERLSLESSTVTPLVKRLEAGGFLTRARSATDERRVDVRLTERGAAMREECGCLGEALLERSGMDGAQLADLNGRVKQLWGALRDPLP